jgi:hypothetical protein
MKHRNFTNTSPSYEKYVDLEVLEDDSLNSVAFSPQANYTYRATAACRRI